MSNDFAVKRRDRLARTGEQDSPPRERPGAQPQTDDVSSHKTHGAGSCVDFARFFDRIIIFTPSLIMGHTHVHVHRMYISTPSTDTFGTRGLCALCARNASNTALRTQRSLRASARPTDPLAHARRGCDITHAHLQLSPHARRSSRRVAERSHTTDWWRTHTGTHTHAHARTRTRTHTRTKTTVGLHIASRREGKGGASARAARPRARPARGHAQPQRPPPGNSSLALFLPSLPPSVYRAARGLPSPLRPPAGRARRRPII